MNKLFILATLLLVSNAEAKTFTFSCSSEGNVDEATIEVEVKRGEQSAAFSLEINQEPIANNECKKFDLDGQNLSSESFAITASCGSGANNLVVLESDSSGTSLHLPFLRSKAAKGVASTFYCYEI